MTTAAGSPHPKYRCPMHDIDQIHRQRDQQQRHQRPPEHGAGLLLHVRIPRPERFPRHAEDRFLISFGWSSFVPRSKDRNVSPRLFRIFWRRALPMPASAVTVRSRWCANQTHSC